MEELKVSYDRVADALYIRLREGKVADSVELNEGMIVDLNERGEIVGLEIINFSKSGVDLDKIVREGVESAAKI